MLTELRPVRGFVYETPNWRDVWRKVFKQARRRPKASDKKWTLQTISYSSVGLAATIYTVYVPLYVDRKSIFNNFEIYPAGVTTNGKREIRVYFSWNKEYKNENSANLSWPLMLTQNWK